MDQVYPPSPAPEFAEIDDVVRQHLQRGHTIFGSYIYKRLLMQRMPNDVDVIGNKFKSGSTIKADVYENKLVLDSISDAPTFTNALILTRYGLRPNKQVSRQQAEFVVENLQAGRYCPWGDMRPKDVKFFSELEQIPASTCELHGFFADAIGYSEKNSKTRYKSRSKRRPQFRYSAIYTLLYTPLYTPLYAVGY